MDIGKDEETIQEKELKKENERWRDYARALLIAIPILLAGPAISVQKTGWSIASGALGIAGIMLIVIWYGRESNLRRFTPRGKYPTALYYTTWCFALQAIFLGFSFLSIT